MWLLIYVVALLLHLSNSDFAITRETECSVAEKKVNLIKKGSCLSAAATTQEETRSRITRPPITHPSQVHLGIFILSLIFRFLDKQRV